MSMGSNPVFPIIFYTDNFSYLISLININKLKKKLTFLIPFTKKTLNLLIILKRYNFIHNFYVIKRDNNFAIKIYLYYYKNKKTPFYFKLISKPSKLTILSYKALRLLNKRAGSSIFIVSTSKGLLSHEKAITLKTGGILIGFFSL